MPLNWVNSLRVKQGSAVIVMTLIFAMTLMSLGNASAQGWDPRDDKERKSKLMRKSSDAIAAFRTADATLQAYFDKAYGYVVFPSITKAAVGVGGARGKGILYRAGQPAKKAYVTQYTVGVQFGGKKYRELIFFRDAEAYNQFIDGEFEFSAQATATIASDGAGETASYDEGVAVFVLDKAGAMFEASLGGQKFKVKNLN